MTEARQLPHQRARNRQYLDEHPSLRPSSDLALLLVRAGRRGQAFKTLAALDAVAPGQWNGAPTAPIADAAHSIATAYAHLGEAEEALAWLEKAAAWGYRRIPGFDVESDFALLRDHPRYAAWREKVSRR